MNKAIFSLVISLCFGSAALAEITLVPVSNVSIEKGGDCGAPPRPGTATPSCPTYVKLSFSALTIGVCDQFLPSIVEINGQHVLRILKTTIDNCTRPQHAPMAMTMDLNLDRNQVQGEVVVQNPLLIKYNYRQ